MTGQETPVVDTGRLNAPLNAEAHRIVYQQYSAAPDDPLASELALISEVDRAHVVMLVERSVIAPGHGGALLREIEELRRSGFDALRSRPIPRGPYLTYEAYLAERLGDDIGGVLHTGRSRNDLNATTIRLRARGPYLAFLMEACRLSETLLECARDNQRAIMPAYTHGQPAVPITYGHYLVGLASSVNRSIEAFLHAAAEIQLNPLGAGAVGGTSIPVDPARTAELLGFTGAIGNSVNAVASRDFVLRLLAAASVLGVTLSRAARDLSTWTTEEFQFLTLADDLVGSSSMMPQKRNPFLLEHVQGKTVAALGGFMSAASSMAAAPYTNAIAVGTEGTAHLWPGLQQTTEATTLLRLVIAGARPNERRMLKRAVDGHTSATHLAECLVSDGVPFRTAHHLVGASVLSAVTEGTALADSAQHLRRPHRQERSADGQDWLHPRTVAEKAAYGGGPGAASEPAAITVLSTELADFQRQFAELRDGWSRGREALDTAVADLIRASA